VQDAGQFRHHMLREIHEQPEAIARTIEHYLDFSQPTPQFRDDMIADVARLFQHHPDLIITASGSSRHAGLAAEILLEDLAGLMVDVEYASEYACRSTHLRRHPDSPTPVLVVSQSGETADTLAALREANRRGHPTIAVTNVAQSTMMREAKVALCTYAGVELAVPATKSFTTQLTLIEVLALLASRERRSMPEDEIESRMEALGNLSKMLGTQLPAWQESMSALAEKYADAKTFLYLGRGVHYAIAREGALKLKESSYLHAEGYPTGELKHGPNALVSNEVPLVVVATFDNEEPESMLRYEKTVSLLYDMRQQGARILAIANTGDATVRSLATDVVEVESLTESLLPIAEVIPLQLFAYSMAVKHGVDVDRPRNLTKAVVAE
jgi:glucosamine--fructose-6-phosphate aminotransferase (isomerizing)